MHHNQLYSTWAEIDLGTIATNIRHCSKYTQTPIMAVVKANAYGHGLAPIAQESVRSGASWLGMARSDEALELRSAGLNGPILLLGYTPPSQYAEVIANRVSLTVWDFDQLQTAAAAANTVGEPARIHIKVDSGMSRLGVQAEDAFQLAQAASATNGIIFEGLFTHFAKADEADPGPTDAQEQRFEELLQALDAAGLRPPLVHAANSAASLSRPKACFNLVRIGIAIYGMHPSRDCRLPSEFHPALAWKATLSQVKTLPAGRGVSYGHIYTTQGNERIGTVPVGYADGYRRVQGNRVLVGGRRVPVIGQVCMDQLMLQLDSVPEARAGDEVVLIGTQGSEQITAEEIASHWGTINYEVTCGIAARVNRLYI